MSYTKLLYCEKCTFKTRQIVHNIETHEYKCLCGQVNKDKNPNEEDSNEKNDKEENESK